MSLDLRELYQEVIIENNRNPHNHYAMEDATVSAKGFNPLCGDKLTVYLKIEGDIVKDISFLGCGCAISQASASLMMQAVEGKTLAQAHRLFGRFHTMLTSDETIDTQQLDKLKVLSGVRAYPVRVKCATLAWHTMEAALNKKATTVSTE